MQVLTQHYMQRIAARPSGTVSGTVLSLEDVPLSGVSVQIDAQTTLTDSLGHYTFSDVPVGSHVLTFQHSLYVLTQRQVTVFPAVDPQLDVNLLSRSSAQHLDADKGGVITEGPLTLSFDPGDLAFKDGTPVHGQIDVVVTVIDPRQPKHILASPARLEGIDVNGNQVGLISYGMAEVEVFQGAKKLQVRPGQSVRASMNISGLGHLAQTDSIPLWHHDTNRGLWVQEPSVGASTDTLARVPRVGIAMVQKSADGALVATTELPHFSSWNWDVSEGATCTVITVPFLAGTTVSNLQVVSTDSSGNADGLWNVTTQCLLGTMAGTRCITVSPSGSTGFGGDTYFKYQAKTNGAWCDLTFNFNGIPDKKVFQGVDINSWLTNNMQALSASWCGDPAPPSGEITGTWNFMHAMTLPNPKISLTANSGSGACSPLIGGGPASLSGDPGFNVMSMNSLSTSQSLNADIDQDGIVDASDSCSGSSSTQTDVNGNGIGDACESWCYIPLSDPMSTFFDFDQDGIDDTCDNRYTVFNPSQYKPSQYWSKSATPNLATADNTAVCTSLTVSTALGLSSQAKLNISGRHDYCAALSGTLLHNGNTVTAFPAGTFPYGLCNFSFTNRAVPGLSGDSSGTWTFCIRDNDGYGDTGVLNTWAVHN